MAKVKLEIKAGQVAAVHQYRSLYPTASVREIATALHLSKSAVDRFLKSPVFMLPGGVDIVELKERAIAMKQAAVEQSERIGVVEVITRLCTTYGYDRTSMPSVGVFDRWFYQDRRDLSLQRQSTSNAGAQRYWFDARPQKHGERLCLDTAIVTIGGQSYVLLAFIDWFSRALWCEIVDFQYVASLPWALDRAITFMGGVPTTIQSDNGVNLAPNFVHLASRIQRFAFARGVQTWEFVPVAEAFRNGKVERVIQTVKDALLGAHPHTLDTARQWLISWLDTYNFRRFHQGISTRKKGGLRTPSDLATLTPLLPATPIVLKVPKKAYGTIIYRRMVVDGVLDLQYPNNAVILSHALNGQYPALVVDTRTLTAVVTHADRAGTYIVGTVVIEKGSEYLTCTINHEMTPRFMPYPIDQIARLKAEAKAMKRKLPRPGRTVNGCRKEIADDYFLVIDDQTGEVVYDSRCGVIPDHAAEMYGIG